VQSAQAASGSGQAYGLNATINVNNAAPAVIVTGNLPNPQADTNNSNPDTQIFLGAQFDAAPLTSPVLTTGVLTGTANATLTGFNTDVVNATGSTDGTGLNIAIAGLVNVLQLSTGTLNATANASCVAGAPSFNGSANITNLQVSVLGVAQSLNLSTGPNNTVLSTTINVVGVVSGNLSIVSNEQTTGANSLSVNGVHVILNATITSGLSTIPVSVDLVVGHAAVAMQSACAALPTLALNANPTPFVRGSTATYTATITNNSGITLVHPLTVTETLASGLTLVAGSASSGWSCAQVAQTVTCTNPSDSAAVTTAVSFDVSVGASAASSVTNDANFGAANDPAPVNCASSPGTPGCASLTTSVVDAAPNLIVTISASPDPFTQGGTGTYTITVTNNGTATATGPLSVTDILPAGVTYVDSTGSDAGWSCSVSSQTVSCSTANPLPSTVGSNTTVVKLNVTIAGNASSPVVDVAGAGSANSAAPDCTLSPLPAGCTSISTVVNPAAGAPNLVVTISASPDPFTQGGTGTYTITVTNNGTATATGPLSVTNILPAGVTYVDSTGSDAGWSCSVSSQTVSCSTANALPSTVGSNTTVVKLNVTIAGNASSPVVDVAGAGSANSAAPDCTLSPLPAGCTSISTVVNPAAGAPNLVVTISASPDPFTQGGTGTYTITVTNNGTATATGPLSVTDILPAGVTYVDSTGSDPGWSCSVSSQTVSCSTANALPSTVGSNTTVVKLNVTIAGNASSPVVDVAGAGGGNSPAPDCTLSPLPAGCTSASTVVNPAAGAPNLVVTISANPDPFTQGGTGTYTITVTNNGTATATGPLSVTDILPSGVTYVDSTGSDPGWSCSVSSQTVSCSTANALPSTVGSNTTVVKLNVTIAGNASSPVVDVAGAGSANSPAPDCTLSPLPAGCTSISTVVNPAAGAPNLVVTLNSNPNPFVRGAAGTLTVSVTNTGNATATGPLTITVTLPTGLTYTGSAGIGWSCGAVAQVVTCTNPSSLAASAFTSVDLQVQVDPAAPASMTVVASAGSSNDPAPANCASVPGQNGCASLVVSAVSPPPGPQLVVTIVPTGPFVQGGTSGYLITVLNVGGGAATGPITVVDILPGGLSFTGWSGAGWTCNAVGQTVTCTNPSGLASGASIQVTLLVQIAGNAPPSVTDVASVGSATQPAVNCSNNPSAPGCVSIVTAVTQLVSQNGTTAVPVNNPFALLLLTLSIIGLGYRITQRRSEF
jgi:uncharacterized repeat protein (TIGR01451 family)